jgi:bifunctional non-homologous end joining protein LigD
MLPRISHRDLMQPTLGRQAFSDPRWVFELKWDGFRCLLIRRGREMRMLTRVGNDLGHCFPEVLLAAARLGPDFAIDGELVVLNHFGHPSFHHLRRRAVSTNLRTIVKSAIAAPATLMAFDLLAVGEHDLRSLTLLQRKAQLQDLLLRDRRLQYVDHVEETGEDMFAAVEQLGLEGIVAKRSDSRYQRGRSRDWIKVKTEIGLEREAHRFEAG